jgi:hypothetical protein
MTEPSRNAAGAGLMLLMTIVLCAMIGLGLGALVGAPAPFAIAGGFFGLGAGFALVYSRFKDI